MIIIRCPTPHGFSFPAEQRNELVCSRRGGDVALDTLAPPPTIRLDVDRLEFFHNFIRTLFHEHETQFTFRSAAPGVIKCSEYLAFILVAVISIIRIIGPDGKLVIFRIRIEYDIIGLAILSPILDIDIHLLLVDRRIVVSRHLQGIGVFHAGFPFMLYGKSVRVLLPVDDKADRSRLFFIRGSWYHDGIDNDGILVIEHIVSSDFYRTPAVIIIFRNRSGQGVDCS